MAVNPISECFWRDLIPEYCQGLESSTIYTAPPFFVESIHGLSNRSQPRLPLHMHTGDIIPTFLTSNIYIGICLPKALALTRLWSYEMFEVLLIVRINKIVGLRGICYNTIRGQNYTPSSLLNDSRIADVTQRVTSTLSTTQRRSIITPTAMPSTSSRNTPAPSRTIQTDSTCRVVSSPASGIASTPTPLSGLENLPSPIPNPDARAIITNPLRTRATEKNQRQR